MIFIFLMFTLLLLWVFPNPVMVVAAAYGLGVSTAVLTSQWARHRRRRVRWNLDGPRLRLLVATEACTDDPGATRVSAHVHTDPGLNLEAVAAAIRAVADELEKEGVGILRTTQPWESLN